MQVSLESTSGLGRKLTVGVPAEQLDTAIDSRLKESAQKVRIDGFRPGKVPMREIKRRFGKAIRQEVVGEVIRTSFYEAITKEELKPAGMPEFQATVDESGKDLEFVATFEIYPEVSVADLSSLEIEKLDSSVEDSDLETMVETLQTQRATYESAERAAVDGDRIELDYEGTKDGEAFNGGSAKGQELTLGSDSMIPGFEDGLIGASAGDEKVLSLSFPDDYHAEDLKGQAVEFKVTVLKVFDKILPEIDAEFMKNFGVETGDMGDFRAEVRKNMERELEQSLKAYTKKQVMDGVLDANELDVPAALVANETQRQKEAMVQQFGGGQQMDLSMFPDELFKDQAERSVKLGLLINEVITSNKLEADAAAVRTFIEKMAAAYEDPEQVINHYYSNDEQLQQIEAVVLEESVVELILGQADVTEKTTTYEEAVKLAGQK